MPCFWYTTQYEKMGKKIVGFCIGDYYCIDDIPYIFWRAWYIAII